MSHNIIENPGLAMSDFHGMATVAPQMRDLFTLLSRISRTRSNVLIRGETGTGKELVARAVHEMSSRSGGPFRAVNCATFTPELLASELFGHVRGAFTGAIRDRQGLFSLANNGTVFLDEIAEMPLDIQARLLRVLEGQSFVPVGATEPVHVNVRIVSATNKALRHEVEERRFRDDLMYRIRVVPVFLPRLVERDGDVEALLWHFVSEQNKSSGERTIEGIEEPAMQAMLEYDWPGNIRELHNAIEYSFAVGIGPHIQLSELPPELRGEGPQRDRRRPENRERDRIVEALKTVEGRKSKAAELLGMSRSTLWRKLREHRIH